MTDFKQKNIFLKTYVNCKNFFQKIFESKKKEINIYPYVDTDDPFEGEYRYYDETGDPFDPENVANWNGSNETDMLTYQKKIYSQKLI